ncbi:TPA: ABC transporter permease [Klebsiella pneumoniae]|uniref:Transport permease protein n=6 Tax=Enterobacterales TaxID=91347 RepID=A6TBD3_KLEP7|nr:MULTISPECIES: ABC transporter permease [Enterobacteriaceae]EJC1962662.1 ABC transporter permease [Citrobacter freundii]HBY9174299.1 ABC transporter permease [Klebsiella pneumoniae MGH 78578]HCA2569226.1 ABC transporter permease [Citrobacter farmeri]HDT5530173.1 ABC transporter permease [Klebsiella pneumoniae subsp. ozaenae]ABR77904.1 O-antigen export - TMD component [Klebsiella pneumoniae subsp. pneumoniae MGH 78578]
MKNPHQKPSLSPLDIVKSIYTHRSIILQMTKRDVIGRYKGSVMGVLWSFLNPLFMLTVYTFVFSVVFKARWSTGGDESRTQFAIILFVGMIVHGFFGEVINRAPQIILNNTNYVKKVIFPLETLSVISLVAALFHTAISLLVLLTAFVIFNGFIHWTIIFIPLVFLPLVIFSLGLSWILASLGVFLRDVSQTTVIITTVLMFLSPVFFPISALPEKYHIWIMLNPLTFIIEQARTVLIWGGVPNFMGILLYTVGASIVAWLGFVFFQKTRKGFADVL